MISNEITIIKYILKNKEKYLNINNIAKDLKIDYKNTYNIVKCLQKKGIIILETFGKSCKITLIQQCKPLIYEAEWERKQEILRNKNLKVVVETYERNIGSRFYVLLLFGSYAKGTNTKNSDIDLLFIVPNECEEQAERNIQSIASLIPLKIHVNIFKEKDFIAMKNSKEQTIGSEAIKNNIILHGIELYYRMIQ